MWRPAVEVLNRGEGLAGLVTFHTGPGLQHYLWVPAARLLPGDVPDPNPVDETDPAPPWR
jgi:hypothetical protein